VPPEIDELRRHLGERIPQSMVPSHFVFIDTMPLTANGKHDHRALPAPEWGALDEELVAPRTPTEERIAAIWCEVLGIERVGVTQDFFSIGGDSIRSIQIVARCKRAEIHLRPSDLFQHSTIAALAALADTAAYVTESTPAPTLEVSREHLDRALAQVAFDGD
jgi:aryl carrier-like protein